MNKYKVAETYKDVLSFFLDRIHFYSGQSWSTKSEHDPGLTSMQLIANAVALLEEQYNALENEPTMFTHTPYNPWQASASGESGALRFKPHLTMPMAQDFKTSPAVSEDIRHMAQAIPGVRRAWVQKKPEDITLLLEFADVMPGIKEDVAHKDTISVEQKKQIIQSVIWHLQEHRGLCQPTLPVREATPFPLNMHVALECEPYEINGNQVEKSSVPGKIAVVMATVGDFLHAESYPKTSFQSSDLLRHLEEVTAVQCASATDENEHFFHGHEEIILSETQNIFKVTRWQFSLEHAGHTRYATVDEIRMAEYLCAAQNVHDIWTKQWFRPAKQEKSIECEDKAIDCSLDSTRAKQIMVHQQFPPCYNIMNTDVNHPMQALQMQGWLLLFEQLLADITNPLDSSDRYFQFQALESENFVGNMAHPLLSKLSAITEYREALASMTASEKHFSQLSRKLLLYLTALQGETVQRYFDKDTQIETSLDNEGIAFLLRRLAYCDSRRLSSNRPQGVERLELGGSILEERLSMLIRPFTQLNSKLPQNYFDMRIVHNPVTGEDEFRCYILDMEGNIRIICNIVSADPLEAERVALMALRFAGLSEHYSLHDSRIHIGWLAKLPGTYSEIEAPACIKACEKWAQTLLPPWVKVLSYEELGEQLPYCLAVFVEGEDIPQVHRDNLADEIRRHIPAHLFPRIFFLTRVDRRRVDGLLRAPDGAGFNLECNRFAALRDILKKYEKVEEIEIFPEQGVKPLVNPDAGLVVNPEVGQSIELGVELGNE